MIIKLFPRGVSNWNCDFDQFVIVLEKYHYRICADFSISNFARMSESGWSFFGRLYGSTAFDLGSSWDTDITRCIRHLGG